MEFLTVDNAVALLALTMMEIILGIDNIVFIAILTARLPEHQQKLGRRLGLTLALVMRILLLISLKWILGFEEAVFELTQFGIPESILAAREEMNAVSWRDLILMGGGLFLIGKSVVEIHEQVNAHHHDSHQPKKVSFTSALLQIAILDIVFSLDSVITAVGMADDLWVMIIAVIFAVAVMLIFSEVVSAFVTNNPTLKMLALSFLILIGVMLVAEGAGTEIEKGYIYFAMTFALIVEFLNLRVRRVKSGHKEAAK